MSKGIVDARNIWQQFLLLPGRKYENNCMCPLEYIDACPDICDTSGASVAGPGGGGGARHQIHL